MGKKIEKDEFPKVFVAENGEKVVALNDIQAAAFEKEGLKQE